MTPAELLEQAKNSFIVLYHGDPDKLTLLLRQALGTYQDKAGVIREISYGTGFEIAVPDDFLTVATSKDAVGNYHEVRRVDGSLRIVETSISVKPYKTHYFVNLRDYDLETDLPPEIIGTLLDYLIALIEIPNTARGKKIALATGQQADFTSEEVLVARKQALEEAMEEAQAIIPIVSVCF
jgi:hypothetical protein